VMDPGTRRFFPVPKPGIEPVPAQNPLLSLAPGKTHVVKFTFKNVAIPDVAEQEPVKNDVVARLKERWKTQRDLIQRGRARVTRSVQPGEGIAPDRLIKLLDTLDQRRVPPILELIRKEFPDAEPANSLTLELVVDEPRRREDWVAPVNKIAVFNGRESVSYFPVNDQVDIAVNSGKNPVTFQIQGIGDYCHLAGLNGDVTQQADGKVTLERKTTYSSDRLVVDAATGFVYRDSYSFRPGRESSQTEHWQFAPRPTPQGLVVPGMSIELHLHNGRIDSILIKTIESIDLAAPISPETFVVSVPAGTSIIDYRDGRDDTNRGVVRSPVTDIITRANEIAATWKRFVPPVKPGDQAPAIEAVVWLNQSGKIDAPKLKGKVVLVDFWGITCGPCVAELPEVSEAAERFAGTDLMIIGLHESRGTVEEVAEFAAKRGMTYPLAIDRPAKESGWFGATFAAYGVRGIPSAAVLDREGKVVFIGEFRLALEKAAVLLK
jgi:thiol-disulfide isomerase/thioredoxin